MRTIIKKEFNTREDMEKGINCTFEEYYTYDDNGNEIHYKDSDGLEWWNEYDDNGKLIHSKDSYGDERFHSYQEI